MKALRRIQLSSYVIQRAYFSAGFKMAMLSTKHLTTVSRFVTKFTERIIINYNILFRLITYAVTS